MPQGVFDQIQNKQDFKDPFKENAERISKTKRKSADQIVEEAVKDTVALPASEPAKKDDLPEISKEDLELAEKMIFNNYAEKDVTPPNLPGYVYTITTMNAEEVNLVDEIVFDYVTENEGKISNQMMSSFRSLCYLALSYRGMNKEELCRENGVSHLNTLKTAVMRYNDLLAKGEIKSAGEIKDEIKKAVNYRVTKLRRLSPTIIDFILDEKGKFENKIHSVMNIKGVIPKS